MQLNLETDYAIRIVYVIANANGRIDAKNIAKNSCVSLKFSLKILRKLVMSGIVISYMGTNGGYELAKDPKDISIYDIIEVIEGKYQFNRCVDYEYICSRTGQEKDCPFDRIFCRMTNEVSTQLKTYTFDKFINET